MKQINALETHLNLELIERTTHGVSLTPAGDVIYKDANFQDYKLRLVTFKDNHEGILSEIMQLGIKFDFLVAVCDSRQWLNKCSMLPLETYKKMIAVSQEHCLAKKSMLTIGDLYVETLMMVKEGDSPANDLIRNDLRKNHPVIWIEDTSNFYDISVFNRCIETGNVLLTIECWQDIHPVLVSIPVNWDYCIPYGLLYTQEPSADVLHFVEAIRHISNMAK